MRTINTDIIIDTVRDMCIQANLYLAEDMDRKLRQAAEEEDGALGKQILNQLIENMEIAALGGTTESVEALIVPLVTDCGKIEVNVAIRERA